MSRMIVGRVKYRSTTTANKIGSAFGLKFALGFARMSKVGLMANVVA